MIQPMRTDPIELEIFKNIYHSIAEEMGAALRRTAFSPNIKERRDYSCAVFDAHGEVIATFRQPFDMLAETATAAARYCADDRAKSSKSEIWLGN